MKPIRLEFNAFGPFSKNEVIDFEAVAASGLFLVSGPTGAGKTTIFDGICFALYGEASGSLRQNEDFKSDFSDPADLCFVRYAFSVREKKFEVYRAPKQKKQKKNGEMAIAAAKAELILPDQSVVTGPAAVSTRLQEIIGLSAKQFKQITMLAQGDFRRFLDASSKEKQEIFRHIFDTEKFNRFTLFLEQQAQMSFSQIEQERHMLNFHLKALTRRDDSTFSQLIEAEYPPIPQIQERLSAFLTEDQNALLAHQKSVSRLEKQCAGLNIETHRLNNQRLQDLEKREGEWQKLSAKKPEIQRLQKQLERLKNTKELLPLWQKKEEESAEIKALKTALKEKEEKLSSLLTEQKAAQEKTEKARMDLAGKDRLLSEITFLQTLFPILEEQEERNQSIAKSTKNLLQIEKELAFSDALTAYYLQEDEAKNLKKQDETLQSVAQAIEEKDRLTALFRRQKEQYLTGYALFFDAQAGILASKLKDDNPCPVCGSRTHPHPAALQSHPPTQEELRSMHDTAEKTAQQLASLKLRIETIGQESAQSAFPLQDLLLKNASEQKEFLAAATSKIALLQKQVQQKLFSLKNTLQEKKAVLSSPPDLPDQQEAQKFAENSRSRRQAEQSVLALHQKRLEALSKKLPAHIRSKEELTKKIALLQSSIGLLEAAVEKTQKDLREIQSQIQLGQQAQEDLKSRIKALQNKSDQTESQFFSALTALFPQGQDDFLDTCAQIGKIPVIEETLERYKLDVTSLSGQILQLKEQTKYVKYIDITNLLEQEQRFGEQIQKEREYISLIQLRLRNDTAHFKAIQSSYQAIEKEEAHYRQVNELFRIARGNNAQRISFESYVLGFYFDAIVSFANQRLETLSEGRYVLCRKKDREKFGRSSGLDLEVLDQYSGKKRPTSTLSGGESFKTALALALSLADVVQMFAGGIVIDTMFIDEGFGSLDSESLKSAVDTLLSLGEGNRLVGIISHVPQLKEQIYRQIQVLPGYHGSTIQIQA